MSSSCYHMGDLFELQCHLWNTFPSHPSCPFFLGYIFIQKPALNSSLGLAAHVGIMLVTNFVPIMGGFSQITLISLLSPPACFCLSLFPPPSLQILMSARSIMEAASTDVLTPGAPTTVNAIRALACMWTAAPASVRNVAAFFFFWQCSHFTRLNKISYMSKH